MIGTNAELSGADVDFDFLDTAKALYVGGYLGMPRFTRDDLIAVLKYARRKGLLTILDVIVSKSADSYLDDFSQILPYVDAFLPNDDEACLLTGEPNPEKQADIFLAQGARNVVITMGQRGALGKSNTKLVKSGAYQVPLVDGSGAGDAFDAGFITAFIDGKSLEEAVELGSAMGASCVRQLGCTGGLFSKEESEGFMRDFSLDLRIRSTEGRG